MARTFKARKAQLRMHVRGALPRFNEDRALRRAQEKSAKELREHVQARAKTAMKPAAQRHEPVTSRGRGMIAGYRATVRKDGTLSLFNKQFSALLFEGGVQPHFIFAKRGMKLKFNLGAGTPFFYPPAVAHPGQRARPVMAQSMRQMTPRFAANLRESIEQEWRTVGA